MGTAAFERDAVLEIDGQKYRMLRKVSNTCWQLEHSRTARISELEQEELLRMYADRKLKFVNAVGETGCGKAHIEISETAKLRRLYVLAALKTDTLTDLQQAISKVWRKTNRPDQPPGCKSVYRWKTRFLESGWDIRALEDEQRTGNRMKRFPSEVLEICEESVDTVYMRRERKHLQDVLDQAIVKVREENRLRPASMALPLPTRRLVKRLVEEIPAFDRYTARYGHDAALRRFRSVEGHRVTHEPLERAEIDHTIWTCSPLTMRQCCPWGGRGSQPVKTTTPANPWDTSASLCNTSHSLLFLARRFFMQLLSLDDLAWFVGHRV